MILFYLLLQQLQNAASKKLLITNSHLRTPAYKMIISPIFEGPQFIAIQLDTSLGKLTSCLSKYIFAEKEK